MQLINQSAIVFVDEARKYLLYFLEIHAYHINDCIVIGYTRYRKLQSKVKYDTIPAIHRHDIHDVH